MMTAQKVILAADDFTYLAAIDLVKRVGHRVYAVKIHTLYDQYGERMIKELKNAGAKRVFVDLKLHDIPKTVELRAQAIKHDGADIISAHASGGVEMLQAASQSGADMYAITLLTSLSDTFSFKLFRRSPSDIVLDLAHLAAQADAAGIVCSPLEVQLLRATPSLRELKLITPGVRSTGASHHDQQRVDAPIAALRAGSDHLVIGRQITEARDPVKALDELEEELSVFAGSV